MQFCLSRPLLVVLLAAGFSAFAARAMTVPESSRWLHRPWQTEDGLPDNDITGVAQTGEGYLWVATKGGLLRFNGAEFTAVPLLELPGVPSRAVRAMFRDSRNRLWLGMERGPILCLEPDVVRLFTSADGLLAQRVMGMAEDQEGGLWIAYPLELRRILKGQVVDFELPPELQGGLITSMASDAQGQIWMARGSRLGVFREGKWQVATTLSSPPSGVFAGATLGLWVCSEGRLFKFEEGQALADHGPWPGRAAPLALFEDRRGALWIGTPTDGLFRLEDGRMESVPTSHQEISYITEDREGDIWVGTTGGGLNLIRPRVVELIGREAGLPFESVQSVCQDTEGRVWAVSQGGSVARGRHGTWELVNGAADWPGGEATCVAADPAGGVWVGTSDSGLKHYRAGIWRTWRQADGLRSDSVRSLLATQNGELWVGISSPDRLVQLREGQLRVIESPGRIGAIRALAESADGTIWIGTAEGQLLRVSGSSLVSEPAIRERITLSIRCLYATPDGSLWIGYAGDGLGRLKNGKHTRVTTEAGLMDDFVSQLLADERGFLWIVSNRGLSRVPLSQLEEVMDGGKERLRSRIYGRNDGVPAFQPNRDHSPASLRADDGRLWFSTRSGLLVVQPDRIRENLDPPPVLLERVSVDDQEVAFRASHWPRLIQAENHVLDLNAAEPALRLKPGHGKLEFEFAGLSYASPENVQFRYQLRGFDQKWIEAGSDRSATYPHLSAGDYEFRVLACNNAGVWNETGAAIPLTVLPFFYETWLFKIGGGLATVLAAGGTVFFLARRRYRRKLFRIEARRALEQERSRIAKDIHDDLGASLTRITLLSQPARGGGDEAGGAAENLEQIHSTARQLTRSMEEVVWAVNPEHDTFDGLANYLSNYAQSFLRVAGVRCRLELPMQLPTQPLSAEVRHNLFLAFKETLNNVVKHAAATEVRISLIPEHTGFILRVVDNGRGLPTQEPGGAVAGGAPAWPGHGNGLANMRSRLQEIGGTCELHSSVGAGTTVTFTVPLRKSHALL